MKGDAAPLRANSRRLCLAARHEREYVHIHYCYALAQSTDLCFADMEQEPDFGEDTGQ